jgi:hypothetical protein
MRRINIGQKVRSQKSALIAVGIGSTRLESVEKAKFPGPDSAQDCSSKVSCGALRQV